MDDLFGTSTERMEQLQAVDPAQREAAWLERQLIAALEGWQAADDELQMLREAREDY
jgi:hypothetical protein